MIEDGHAWLEWHNEYIRSDAWHRRRARLMRDRKGQCEACGSTGPLDGHHNSYEHAGAGQEPDEDLNALCRNDHIGVHRYHQSGRYIDLKAATAAYIADAQRHREKATKRRERAKRIWRLIRH